MYLHRTLIRGLCLLVLIFPMMLGLFSGQAMASSLKVLAIGNSFSQDSMQHLYQIATDAGLTDVVIGNLYIGGSSLEVHWSNAKHNLPNYRYDKNVDGTWRSVPNRTILHGLLDEDWDVITVQQVSGYSGIPSSFLEQDRLQNLINYVNEHKTNPDAKIAWHQTWAYQADSTHSNFRLYNSNQEEMFAAIIDAVQSEIVNHKDIDVIIPSGTAIQNVRTSYIGDTLTRDGYHLSYNLGRYIAGLTWIPALTGLPIDDISWVPNVREVPEHYLPLIKEAVNAAIENPFSVTQSSFVEKPQLEGAQASSEDEFLALVPEIIALKTTKAPTIDGNLDDQVWLDAAIYGSKLGGFVNHTGKALAIEETVAYVAYDDENFYIAIVAFKSDMDALVANQRTHDTDVHKDDSVEVFWDTTHSHSSFHHIINNALGTKSDVIVRDWSWNPEWQLATKVLEDRWISEIAIPFSELGFESAPEMGTVWGFNVNRNDMSSGQHTGWATTYGSFLSPQHFGHLIFGGYID